MSFFIEPLNNLHFLIAAVVGLICGALGPFLVWKRLGLLSDTVSHAAMFVVALSFYVDITPTQLLIPFSVALGILLSVAQERKFFELDSVLAIFFSGFMGLGIVLMSLSGKGSEEILHLLFGEIQTTGLTDLFALLILGATVLSYLWIFRKNLWLMLTQSELAQIEGINVTRHSRTILVLCCVTVALTLKLMGVVLVTSLFVAPALSSLSFAKSAKQHAISSIVIGVLQATVGLFIADNFQLPGSATVSSLGLFIFLISLIFRKK